ncbi:MAG: hypothetical protein K0Q56_2004 [Sporolactobacillus laevolacticus]|nr:hypothetical protein [Sporolactobacillus laevolacticus]
MSIEVLCNEKTFTKPVIRAVYAAGGELNVPSDFHQPVSFVFKTVDSFRNFNSLRKLPQKNVLTDKMRYMFFAQFEIQMRLRNRRGPAESAKRMKMRFYRKMKQASSAKEAQ